MTAASSSKKDVSAAARLSKKAPPPSTTLAAVALQDHLSRQLSLLDHTPSLWRSHAPPGCRRCGKTPGKTRGSRQLPLLQGGSSSGRVGRTAGLGSGSFLPPVHRAHANHVTQAPPTATSVASCPGHRSSGGTARSRSCGTHGACHDQYPDRIRPGGHQMEYILDAAPPPPTLAQRLGLVEAPPPLLTAEEWVGVKASSNARKDSALPCPICQDLFGVREQVLLSCSHVFHLACLRSFEKHSGHKSCPLCRRRDYQARVIFKGVEHARNTAATRIQAVWRGYVVRKWYQELRQRVPPSDPHLRKKFYQERLSAITERLVRSCDSCASGVESVLAQADQAVASARNAIRLLELHSQLSLSPAPWEELRAKALDQLHSDCPVCLAPFKPRPLAILSCGHLFHLACVMALEEYCEAGPHLCPLCRGPYQRQTL